jgi:hypothetical protein
MGNIPCVHVNGNAYRIAGPAGLGVGLEKEPEGILNNKGSSRKKIRV